jgi:uncharacterized protein YdhG (YjbR/CyaY superfamily)
MKASKDIDSYIASYPRKTQVLLKKMRAVICKAAPQATEAISYGVPTYKLNGNLVHFGGFKSHIGFFPDSLGHQALPKGAISLQNLQRCKSKSRSPLAWSQK